MKRKIVYSRRVIRRVCIQLGPMWPYWKEITARVEGQLLWICFGTTMCLPRCAFCVGSMVGKSVYYGEP